MNKAKQKFLSHLFCTSSVSAILITCHTSYQIKCCLMFACSFCESQKCLIFSSFHINCLLCHFCVKISHISTRSTLIPHGSVASSSDACGSTWRHKDKFKSYCLSSSSWLHSFNWSRLHCNDPWNREAGLTLLRQS